MLAQYPNLRRNDLHVRIFSVFSFILFITVFGSSSRAQPAEGKKKSTFTAHLINIESVVKDPFRYNTSLYNGSGNTQVYALQVQAPDGWITLFRTAGSQVTAVRLDSGKTQEISLEIMASPIAKPGKYTIPVSAVSNNDSLRIELEAVVKGNYSLELTTPTGRLSDDVTEGRSKQLRLVLKNTGSLPLDGLELSAQSPVQWSTTFEPSKIERLDPGQTMEASTTLSVPDKTIAGDYVTTFTAKNSYTTANAVFRMTVKTSLLSGWIGILVILLALGMVYYLVRKYGRR
ncbi:NEW3 domain-containing protein [Agriterribacter sp.]|uniref:COG1470 family protein n=1 Tax=Agriterribacter sp. TaxID=2821509 RepID=UPI002CC1ADA2|nr:NEW3 domain-containing protein [Agriterribacter sp.]HRO47881.1 NEW3 domain-containing protein [Agriterribacter sp.]HRQ18823.1 NEW3 domain-containing protein [Agriterribacter sp.]